MVVLNDTIVDKIVILKDTIVDCSIRLINSKDYFVTMQIYSIVLVYRLLRFIL